MAKCPNEKLAPRFYGPFEITACVGTVAYCLQLPPTSHIHPVFHVSQLKKAVALTDLVTPLHSQLSEDLELLVELDEVLNVRSTSADQVSAVEVLIKWKGLPIFEATWEPYELLQQQFPDFHLEDKVTRWGRGSDRPPIRYTYARRNRQRDG